MRAWWRQQAHAPRSRREGLTCPSYRPLRMARVWRSAGGRPQGVGHVSSFAGRMCAAATRAARPGWAAPGLRAGWLLSAWASNPGSQVPLPCTRGTRRSPDRRRGWQTRGPVARQPEHGCGPAGNLGLGGLRPRLVAALGCGIRVIVAAQASRRLAPVEADGRYAPPPSGPLHLGNLRTALLAWLASRPRAGALPAGRRSRRATLAPGDRRAAAAGSRELGLDHDGPILWQSKRLDRYDEAFRAPAGCRCALPLLLHPRGDSRGGPRTAGVEGLFYPGTCRELSAQRAPRTRPPVGVPAWRLRSSGAEITFDDGVLGEQRQHAEDVVLRRADGAFGYQLAVVVDDADQGVASSSAGRRPPPLRRRAARDRAAAGPLRAPLRPHATDARPDGERLAKHTAQAP